MANERSTQDTNSSNNQIQLVIFKLAGEEFGIDIMQVQEIIRLPALTRIPQAPGYVKGIINLRGKIIVVMNLGARFGMDSKDFDDNSRIIIVKIDETVVGMIVDSVSEVIRIPAKNIESAPNRITSKVHADYLHGVGVVGQRLLILLDMEKVLVEEETL